MQSNNHYIGKFLKIKIDRPMNIVYRQAIADPGHTLHLAAGIIIVGKTFTIGIKDFLHPAQVIIPVGRGLRKVSKTRAIFPNEDALTKLLYLAIRDMAKRWTMKIKNWGMIYSQLCIYFEERLENYL